MTGETPIYPCKCTAYNGGQCYNCLNGAHYLCAASCDTKTTGIGIKIVYGPLDTPRTDAARIEIGGYDDIGQVVPIAVSKQLERELLAMTAERDRANGLLRNWCYSADGVMCPPSVKELRYKSLKHLRESTHE